MQFLYYGPESKIDAWCFNLFSHWKAVIPEFVSGIVHEQKTPMGQLQLHRLNLMFCRTSSCILVSENEVTSSP